MTRRFVHVANKVAQDEEGACSNARNPPYPLDKGTTWARRSEARPGMAPTWGVTRLIPAVEPFRVAGGPWTPTLQLTRHERFSRTDRALLFDAPRFKSVGVGHRSHKAKCYCKGGEFQCHLTKSAGKMREARLPRKPWREDSECASQSLTAAHAPFQS